MKYDHAYSNLHTAVLCLMGTSDVKDRLSSAARYLTSVKDDELHPAIVEQWRTLYKRLLSESVEGVTDDQLRSTGDAMLSVLAALLTVEEP